MKVEDKLRNYAKQLEMGRLSISEAENCMEGAIIADCMDMVDMPDAWVSNYYALKRKGWRLLLKATGEK